MSGSVPRLRQPAARFILLLFGLGLLGVAALVLPPPDPAQAPRLAPITPFAAVLVAALLLMALVPRTVVTLACGAMFGPIAGAGYALAAALLAAMLCFQIGRLLGRDFVREQLRPAHASPASLTGWARARLARLDGWLSRTNVLDVVAVRLLPVGGFGLVSYAYGLTGARLAPYLAGSVLASAPSAFGYAAVGAAVAAPHTTSWFTLLPAGLGLLAAMAVLTARWRSVRLRRSPSGRAPR